MLASLVGVHLGVGGIFDIEEGDRKGGDEDVEEVKDWCLTRSGGAVRFREKGCDGGEWDSERAR